MNKHLSTACLFVVTTLAIVFFIALPVFGQEKQTAKANPPPAESITARVDQLFAQWDKPDSPGCALGIVKDGQLIYKRGYGMANLDYKIPISSGSVSQIASMVKQFVGMSILLLSKQGKLSLDDEIQEYLPEIPRYQSPITIRHLIHHTSGIRNQYILAEFAGIRSLDLTEEDGLALIARQKELNHKPGEEFIYSDTSYFLLGLIVKKVSGKSEREFAGENIFKPLGMTNTNLEFYQTSVVRNRSSSYRPDSNQGFSVVGPITEFSEGITKSYGEMFTTVEDLFLWDQNFYKNKLGFGSDLISEQLSTGTFNNGEKVNYAVGLFVDEYKGLKRVGHTGADGGGFESAMYRYPEQNFSVICLCNVSSSSPWVLADQVADIFLADQFKQVPDAVKETVTAVPNIIDIPVQELVSLAGLYFDHNTERHVYFYLDDGKLMVAWETRYALSPLSQNRFKIAEWPGLEIHFERAVAGGPMQVKLIESGKTMTYEAAQRLTPASADLGEFAGNYVSDELGGAIYTLSIKHGKLILQVRSGITVFNSGGQVVAITRAGSSEAPKDLMLTPEYADAFVYLIVDGSVMMRFTRNRQNAVSGFTLSTGAEFIRRLRFNKQ